MKPLTAPMRLSMSLGSALDQLNSGLFTRSRRRTSFSISVRLRRISASVSTTVELAGMPDSTALMSTMFWSRELTMTREVAV